MFTHIADRDDTPHNASVTSQDGSGATIASNSISTMGESAEWLSERLLESLAKYAHDSWSTYMRYFLLNCGNTAPDGTLTIPASYLAALWKQINTPYAELSAKEQDSDRIEAERMLQIILAQSAHAMEHT